MPALTTSDIRALQASAGLPAEVTRAVGEQRRGRVLVISELGFGYVVDDANQRYGISQAILGKELFSRLHVGDEVLFRCNAHDAIAGLEFVRSVAKGKAQRAA